LTTNTAARRAVNALNLATVHSFKGWEINTLFLVVYGDEASTGLEGTPGGRERISDEELVYTAITRCRHKLFVANRGDCKYHDFFSRVKAGDRRAPLGSSGRRWPQ
jgi:hypothetical protein